MTQRTVLILASIFLLSFNPLIAQFTGMQQDTTPGLHGRGIANFYFAKPGDFTILVSVWGAVGRSGRYEIPIGSNVGNLISLAGGPGSDPRGFTGADIRGGNRRINTGKTIVRLSRLFGEERRIIMELRIEDLLHLHEHDIPLRDGDILMIDSVQHFNLWDGLMLVTSGATFILLIDRIFTIF